MGDGRAGPTTRRYPWWLSLRNPNQNQPQSQRSYTELKGPEKTFTIRDPYMAPCGSVVNIDGLMLEFQIKRKIHGARFFQKNHGGFFRGRPGDPATSGRDS